MGRTNQIVFWILLISLQKFSKVEATNIHIGAKYNCKRIQEAIDLAAPFDTLFIHGGLYKEGTLIIAKPLIILGQGNPIIDGQKKFECVSIKSSDVCVKGLTVQNSGTAVLNDPGGIKVYDAQRVQIENNLVLDNFFGIYLQQCKHVLIKNNVVKAKGINEQQIGNGIHCWKSDSIQIIGNRIQGQRDGIYFEFVTNTLSWRNVSTYNIRYGIHFMFSNNDTYISNVFRNNGSGNAVMFSNHVTMIRNVFKNNQGAAAYGILLKELSDCYIHGNYFEKNTVGLFLEGANRMNILRNQFDNNGWAIRLQASCMDNNIIQNNFLRNTFDCGTNGDLVLNTFDSNYWDQYEGYDLNHDQIGDIPFHPLSLFSVVIEKNPPTMMFFRSLMVNLLDQAERFVPSLTPENFKDNHPKMKPYSL